MPKRLKHKYKIRQLTITPIYAYPPPECYIADVRIQLRSKEDWVRVENTLDEIRRYGAAELLQEGTIAHDFDNVSIQELRQATFVDDE